MAKVWSDFYDYISPEIPGWDPALVNLAIRSVVLDFYDDTGVYVVDHAAITLVQNVTTYSFTPPTGWDVARPHTVWFDSLELRPRGEDELKQLYYQWNQQVGAPLYYMCEDQNTIRVVPAPDANSAGVGRLTLRVVLKPSRTSTGISTDWVFDRWVDVIADGVKGKLMAMPAKPWSNPALGVFYTQRYRTGKDEAIRDMNKSLTRARVAVRMRPAERG